MRNTIELSQWVDLQGHRLSKDINRPNWSLAWQRMGGGLN